MLDVPAALDEQHFQPALRERLCGPAARDAGADDDRIECVRGSSPEFDSGPVARPGPITRLERHVGIESPRHQDVAQFLGCTDLGGVVADEDQALEPWAIAAALPAACDRPVSRRRVHRCRPAVRGDVLPTAADRRRLRVHPAPWRTSRAAPRMRHSFHAPLRVRRMLRHRLRAHPAYSWPGSPHRRDRRAGDASLWLSSSHPWSPPRFVQAIRSSRPPLQRSRAERRVGSVCSCRFRQLAGVCMPPARSRRCRSRECVCRAHGVSAAPRTRPRRCTCGLPIRSTCSH